MSGAPEPTGEVPIAPLRKRFRKFRSLRRGWWSFVLLSGLFALSFFDPLLINDKPLVLHHDGVTWYPAIGVRHEAKEFGQRIIGEPKYRDLAADWAEKGGDSWMILPPYPYHPNESLLKELEGTPPHPPSTAHWFGTDDRGRDVFARLVYGFRMSLAFGLGVVTVSYAIGITVGAVLGFFGGRVDMFGQRLVEIWAGVPFLYTVIIVSSIVKPNPFLLVVMLGIFGWVGIAAYVRGEFYREKSRDYVAAAVASGESSASIMFRHVLPNALTPVITFAPFSLVAGIISLVSLDFLGFGVAPPTASWGELVKQGRENIFEWHLVIFPLGALFCTLLMVVFIGEAVREAFDPKTWSRLR